MPVPNPVLKPPLYLEVSAEKGGVGKSTIANRLRDHVQEAGIPVLMVRVDSKRALPTAAPGETVIHSEDFAGAADRIGGVAGVLAPIWEALEAAKATGSAVVVDWGAGLTDHRLEMMAATNLNALLAAAGIPAFGFVVTTRDVEVMKQAARNLSALAKVAPDMVRVLVQNAVGGSFRFDAGTMQGQVYHKILQPAAKGSPIIDLPLIGAQAYAPFQAAGISMREALSSDPRELAERIGKNIFITHAILGHLTMWWDESREGLNAAVRFPEAAAEDSSILAYTDSESRHA
jgi:hypothetical protein